jgi:hypothetical protein
MVPDALTVIVNTEGKGFKAGGLRRHTTAVAATKIINKTTVVDFIVFLRMMK